MPLKITSTFLLVNQIILRLVTYFLTFFPHLFFFGLFLQRYLSIFTFLSSLWNTVNLSLFQNFFGLTDFLYLRILLVDFKELSSSYYYVPKKDILYSESFFCISECFLYFSSLLLSFYIFVFFLKGHTAFQLLNYHYW